MKATIVLFNHTRGMVAAETEDGEFVVFEILDDYDLEIGDIISHSNFLSMGGGTYRNITKEENMDVFVEKVCATLKQAKRACFL